MKWPWQELRSTCFQWRSADIREAHICTLGPNTFGGFWPYVYKLNAMAKRVWPTYTVHTCGEWSYNKESALASILYSCWFVASKFRLSQTKENVVLIVVFVCFIEWNFCTSCKFWHISALNINTCLWKGPSLHHSIWKTSFYQRHGFNFQFFKTQFVVSDKKGER